MSEIKQEFNAAMEQLTAPGAPYELAGDVASGHYYAQAPANLVEAFAVARQHGDREFLIYEGERRSFNELMDEADALGAALQAHGIVPGDRVALAMRNYPEWMSAFIGVTSIGAVIVPVNSWGKPADIAYTVEDAGARVAICDQQRYDGCRAFRRERDRYPDRSSSGSGGSEGGSERAAGLCGRFRRKGAGGGSYRWR
jgi:non-ribosomal peptide synthetase component F